MSEDAVRYETNNLQGLIVQVRGMSVILDNDLARAYGVTTKRLNEQVRRNADRFPADFMFQLTQKEFTIIRSKEETRVAQLVGKQQDANMWSQIATTSNRRRTTHVPFAFTEHGAIMAATVLNSPQAVQMSVFVVRAFVAMRSLIVSQQGLAKKLAELEKTLTARLDTHEHAITDIIQQIMQLLTPPPPEPETPRPKIGFEVKERQKFYRTRVCRVEKRGH